MPQTLLVIEDEAGVRETIALFLEDKGSVVFQAENGQQGLELFHQHHPDIVLVDLRMPGIDGLEVISSVKEASPDTPVIVVSGTGVLADAVEALRRGAWDYVLKPIEDMKVLEHAVNRATEQYRLIQENRHYQRSLEQRVQERTAELEVAYQVLQERENRLAGIINSVPDHMSILDNELTVLWANDIAAQKFGPDMVGKKCFETYGCPPDRCERCLIKEVFKDGRIRDQEFEFTDAGNRIQSLWRTVSPVDRYQDGRPRTVIEVGRDVTERRRLERSIRSIVEGTAFATGQAFFESLVRSLARALEVEYVLVGELLDNDCIQTLAVWAGDKIGDNFVYDLEGTPCENVVNQSECIYPRAVQSQFPQDKLLAEMGVKSYIGTPLRDPTGKTVGILVALDVQPLEHSGTLSNLMTIFGARAVAEVNRMRLEQQVRESERQLQDILQNVKLAAVMLDLEGRITYVNRFLLELTGWQREQVLGYDWCERFIPPEDRAHIKAVHQENVTGGRKPVSYFENEILTCSGERRMIAWNNVEIRGTEGKPVGTCSLGVDITERKREERVQTAQLRLIEYAADHTVLELLQSFLDEVEAITKSRIGFYHFVKEDQESLSLQTWSTNTLEKMCTAKGAGMHYSIANAGVWVDCVYLRKPVIHNDYASLTHKKGLPQGHAPVIRELVVPVFRGDKIVAILGVGNKATPYDEQDVKTVQYLADMAWETVERKQAEEQLAIFKKFAEASTQGLGMANLEGQIVYCNDTLCRIFLGEEEPQKAIGKHVACYYDETSAKMLQEQFLPVGLEIGHWTGEMPLVSVDGKVTEAIQSVFLIHNDKGEPTYFANVITDIAERKRLEERAKEHQAELIHVSRLSTLGEMASGLAHEINQPLASILCHADLCLSTHGSETTQSRELVEYLEEIANQAELAGGIVNRIKHFSRKKKVVHSQQSINNIIQHAIALIKWEVDREGARIRLQLDQGEPRVLGDPVQLEQVIINLIRNSLDAMTTANLEHKELFIQTAPFADRVEVTVRDSGPGVPASLHDTIFNPFFSSKSEGLGLGLTISQTIVTDHKGRLWVASSDSSGTRMVFQLPIAQDQKDPISNNEQGMTHDE